MESQRGRWRAAGGCGGGKIEFATVHRATLNPSLSCQQVNGWRSHPRRQPALRGREPARHQHLHALVHAHGRNAKLRLQRVGLQPTAVCTQREAENMRKSRHTIVSDEHNEWALRSRPVVCFCAGVWSARPHCMNGIQFRMGS